MLIKASTEIIIEDFGQPCFANCDIILTPADDDDLGKEVLPQLFQKSHLKLVVADAYLPNLRKNGAIRVIMQRQVGGSKL